MRVMVDLPINQIIQGDALEVLKTFPDERVDMVMTSPPYWALRDYGVEGQMGLEPTFKEYINKLCDIFDEVKRVLKNTGTCWVNMGDSYSQSGGCGWTGLESKNWKQKAKPHNVKELQGKNLCNIPARFSIEMQNRGWILRNVIIWYKRNCMPSSVADRFTVDFEYLYFFVKNKKYWFEQQHEELRQPDRHKTKLLNYDNPRKKEYGKSPNSINPKTIENHRKKALELGRNKRCVWDITTRGYREAHFATYPEVLCETPIKAGCIVGGIVLDPFSGAGTTALVAKKNGRNYIGIELNPEYVKMSEIRLHNEAGLL